jgi:hypothetical protein
LIAIGVRRWLRGPARSDEVVVLDADSDRLGVAEPVCGGVAAGAGVVVVKARDLVEPEHPAQVGELRIDRVAEASLQCRVDPSGEGRLLEGRDQLCVQGRLS